MMRLDAAVVGLGAFGSAAACHLARRGGSVIGFDRFSPPHDQGSSHGGSRIIREAYFEDPRYVPLVRRAYALWEGLGEWADKPLLYPGGGLLMGPPDGEVVPGVREAARVHGIAVEAWDAAAVAKRFPGLRLNAGHEAVFEPRAGTLVPERCVTAHLKAAKAAGATLRPQEPVEGWRVTDDGVHLWTPEGDYLVERLVLAAGAWTTPLLRELGVPLQVERQVQFWLQSPREAQDWSPKGCPIFAVEPEPGRLFYGLPDLGDGVKVAVHHEGETVDPDTVDRAVHPHDEATLRAWLRAYLPALDVPVRTAKVCLYTNTPDRAFVIDRHPDHPEVVIAAGGSGHGFKFSAAIGEAAAALAVHDTPKVDLAAFRLDRPALRI